MYCVPEKEVSLRTYQDKYSTLHELHPDWSAHELRLESAFALRPQFQQDAETAKQENLGLAIYAVPQAAFVISETGSVIYPNYGSGVGLVELSERTQQLMPENYSPEEHATSLLVDAQFGQGATTVVTSYGGRDVVIMTYDPIKKEGSTKIINTEALQKDQQLTIQEFIHQQFPKLESVFLTDRVFLFADKKLSVSHAKNIVRPVLQDTAVSKTQFVHLYQQENRREQDMGYLPLPFVSPHAGELSDVIVEHTVPEFYDIPFIVKQEEQQQQVTANEQHIQHTRIVAEEKKTVKKFAVDMRDTAVSPQENTSTVLFQYKEIFKTLEPMQTVVSQPVCDRVTSEQKNAVIADDAVLEKEVQKAVMKQQKEHVGDWQSNSREFHIESAQFVTDIPFPPQEVESEYVDVVQQEDSEKDVVVQETLEAYFSAGIKESVREIAPDEVYSVCADTAAEKFHEAEYVQNDVKKIRKLCWVLPLTETMEEPAMFEVEMPKDQNQRLYNLLHFLRKVIKRQFGEDMIQKRQIQVMNADMQHMQFEEIEYYLSLLQQKSSHTHLFAMVS